MPSNLNQVLAKPLRIGNITAKNRIWLSPMESNTCSVNGEITEVQLAHYEARARGGVGLIVQEFTAVDGKYCIKPVQTRIDHDKYKVGLSRLVSAVHAYGTPIICQLHHAGMFSEDPVSPSGVATYELGKGHYIQPRVITTEEIETARDKFIAAAVRAQEIGYDGVELHGATAYLLAQFFSPYNNKRTDKYGGGIEGRMLLALEIVRGIRQKCGPNYAVGYTMADKDWLPGGVDRDDAVIFAKSLEREGLTYLDFQTDGTYETFTLEQCAAGARRQPKGTFGTTKVYKQFLRIPVTCRSAGEYDPAVWEDAVKNGYVDAVRVAKPHLADPELARKVLSGRTEDVRPCIKCLNCLDSAVVRHMSLNCSVNSGCAHGEKPLEPARAVKKVAVIGGGPAGLEAARVAAARGHIVTLIEKQDHLGGNFYIASLPVGKEDFLRFVVWAESQCRKLGVDIRLNTEDAVKTVKELSPDAVILATGAKPVVPPIEGVSQPHVVLAQDVLQGKVNVGKKVVVIGGGEVGLETADTLLFKDIAHEVTVVEILPEVGRDMAGMDKASLFGNQFPKYIPHRLRLVCDSSVERILEKKVLVRDRNWRSSEIEADTVVVAAGYSADRSLYDAVSELVGEVYVAGDAVRARKLVNAVHESNNYARLL
ncbi:MAG: FAD-dependent oxidoreductase [Gracilibacteraceae bacterium]|jgi:2,4-dienoyl-CoA reductase-like NADH-dependent reductase (Old Yellow Enzyme family)/NADPH-dependent 2,4-dienoyl-CoA reductase/sulfur reductase-like enzyme|nr:FAD-dependent oxidoreductase [Gracilibacteraceae bacterium]